MPRTIESFGKEYRDACFFSWYGAGCPSNIRGCVPKDKDGRLPSNNTLKRWYRDDGWQGHADAMDAQLSVKIETEIIERKKQDYVEMAEYGRDLLRKAMAYLNKEGFDSAAAAVRGVDVGAGMVAKYSRAAEMVDAVLNKTDRQVESEIYRLLGKNSDTEIVDVETNADSDTEEDDNS